MSFVTDQSRVRKGKPAYYVFQGLTVLLALFIAVQSLTPSVTVGSSIYSDKVVHALAYFGLTALAILGWPHIRKLKLATFAFIFGTGIEFIQALFVTGRTGSFWDGTANLFGILLAVSLLGVVLRNSRFR